MPNLPANGPLRAALEFGPLNLTAGLIGLDEKKKFCHGAVVTERQPLGLGGALRATFGPGRADFEIDLERVPTTVRRLMFVVGRDGLPVSQAKELRWTLPSEGLSFNPLSALHLEQAVILGEFYRHAAGWRLAALGQGYEGGWTELLQRHGVTEAIQELFAPVTPVPSPSPSITPEVLTWEVHDGQGKPLLTLREAQSLDLRDSKRLTLSAAQRAELGLAVQGAVKMAAGVVPALLNANTYHLALSKEMRVAMRQGGTLLKTGVKHHRGVTGAVRHASNGKLIGTGSFKPAHLARVANIATIAFQIAAVVTAQYYLHNINQQLQTIDRKLDDLQEFVETQATGRLIAGLKGIARNVKLLESRSLDPDERAAALGDVLGLIREAESQAAQHELPMANLDAVFKTKDQFKLDDAKQSLLKHGKNMNTALFAAWANIQALQLGIHLGWAEDRLTLHQEDLVRSLEILNRATDVFEKGLSRFDAEARAKNAPRMAENFHIGKMFPELVELLNLITRKKRKTCDQQRETFRASPEGWVSTLDFHRQMLAGLHDAVQALRQDQVEIERQRKAPVALVVQTNSAGEVLHAFMQEDPVVA
ncbi:TerD family protein [Deinococcus saxicola]